MPKRTYVRLTTMLHIIINSGVDIQIEDRHAFGFNTYMTRNHAEIIGFWNRADNCLWDVQLLGYDRQLPVNETYYTDQLLGYIEMPNRNHKILLKLKGVRGWSRSKFIRDSLRYIREYKKINKMQGNLILF